MNIRDATPADFEQILGLNAESVNFLSPLSAERLAMLHGQAVYHRVVQFQGRVVGFLIALREGAAYDSVNYQWFVSRFPKFLYIDRVVVASSMHGLGVGKLFYADLFAFGRAGGAPVVACEFDVDPPNVVSQRFHEGYGFQEIGSHRVGLNHKRVSLQAMPLGPGDDKA